MRRPRLDPSRKVRRNGSTRVCLLEMWFVFVSRLHRFRVVFWLLLSGCGLSAPDPIGSPVFRRFDSGQGADAALNAGESEQLLRERGAGVIRRVWIRARSCDSAYLEKLVLEARWDDAVNPAVSALLATLFAAGRAYSPPLATEFTTWARGGMSIHLAMPFSVSADLRLRNLGPEPVEDLAWEIDIESGVVVGRAVGKLHARHIRSIEGAGASLDVSGQGRYFGTTLVARGCDPRTSRISLSIDADPARSVGSLNLATFFGGSGFRESVSWTSPEAGIRWLSESLAVAHRWHSDAPIPFARSLLLELTTERSARRSYELSAVAFWYQANPAGQSPASYVSSDAAIFSIEGVIEAENLLPPLYSSGDRCLADITTLLGEGWSGNRQLLFLADARDDFVVLEIPIAAPGVYDLHLAYTSGPGYGSARATIDGLEREGVLLEATPSLSATRGLRALRGVRVEGSSTALQLRLTVEKPGPAYLIGLDHVRLEAVDLSESSFNEPAPKSALNDTETNR